MTLFAILPVKPLAAGKSRLAEVMSTVDRIAFNRRLAEETLHVASSVVGAGRTMVVSRDSVVLGLARKCGAPPVREHGDAGLNAALDQASAEARRRGADAVLVLPVDLPLLTPEDIAAMMSSARPTVVIAPDRQGAGTNALLLAPPAVIPFAFGPGSFEAHRAAAHRAGIAPVIVRREGLAFDVDTAADHALLSRRDRSRAAG